MEKTRHMLGKAEVAALIPQKFPFVMVDKLLAYTETSVMSGFTITQANIFVDSGKFTEPGIIEHMAQSVALHTGYQFFLRNEAAPTGYIGSIGQLEIKALPATGNEIISNVSILHEFAGITLVEIETKCLGDIIATGQMKTVLAK